MIRKQMPTITILWKLFFWFGGIVALILLISSLVNYNEMSKDIKEMGQNELEWISDSIYQATTIAFDNAVKVYLEAQADRGKDLCVTYHSLFRQGILTEEEAQLKVLEILENEEYGSIGEKGYISLFTGSGKVKVSKRAFDPGIVKMITNKKNGYLAFKTDAQQKSGQFVAWLVHFKPWDYIICSIAQKSDLKFLTNTVYFKSYLQTIRIGENGYPFIFNSRGEMLIHPELEGANLYHQKDKNGKEFVKEMIQKKNGSIIYIWKKPENNEIGKKFVTFRYNPELDWIIASGVYEDELYAPLYRQRTKFGLFILTSLGVVLVTAFFFSSTLTRPIRQIVALLERAKGGDLTQRLTVTRMDEMGRIMVMINEFLDILHQVTSNIHENTEELNSSTTDLTSISQEIFSTANQQAAAVAEVVATVEEFATMSRQMAKNASGVAQVALDTEKDVERGAGNVNATLERMKIIKSSNEENIHELNKLRKRVEQINEVLKFINNIADQTKLIAFNAALEASSSEGESGKRFGIVAIEIRRLAEGIVEQTRDIEETINEITQATHELLLSFEQSSAKVEEGYTQAEETAVVLETILSGSKQTRKASKQIDSGTSQQQIALEQIVNTLKEISETVQHFVGATKQSDGITREITEISEQFKKSVSHFRLISS